LRSRESQRGLGLIFPALNPAAARIAEWHRSGAPLCVGFARRRGRHSVGFRRGRPGAHSLTWGKTSPPGPPGYRPADFLLRPSLDKKFPKGTDCEPGTCADAPVRWHCEPVGGRRRDARSLLAVWFGPVGRKTFGKIAGWQSAGVFVGC